MKASKTLTLHLCRRAQPWMPRCSHLALSIDHRWLNMEVALRWILVVAILKGKLFVTKNTEGVNEYEWITQWLWSSFLSRVSLCLQVSCVRHSLWILGEVLYSLECPWDSPVGPWGLVSVAIAWTGSSRLQRRGWNGSQASLVVFGTYTTQTGWRTDSPPPGTVARTHFIYRWAAWD